MFVAQDEKGQSISLLDYQAVLDRLYFCPGCHQPVRLRRGKVIRPHFAHVSLEDCRYFSEPESAQHLDLKMCLYQWACQNEQAEIEKRLPEIEQIADVLVGDKLVLEVQCSPLAIDRLRERTRSYQQSGYQVLWLLGKKLWLKKRLTYLQKQCLYFSQHLGFFLWELDLERRCLRLCYLIHEDLHGQVQYLTKEFKLERGNLLDVLRFPYQQQKVAILKGRQDHQLLDYLARQLYHQSPKWMAIQAKLYQEGQNLLTQSLEDFYPQIRPPKSSIGFVQIQQDLSDYYVNFEHYYQRLSNKDEQYLYSPAFYRLFSEKISTY